MMSELDFIRIGEVARLAGLTVGTCYTYNATRSFEMPLPCRAIGATKFWSRMQVMAWIRSRKRSRVPKPKDFVRLPPTQIRMRIHVTGR
jgi:predicted DNA-binding transcriptional regulator AlpA